MPPPASIKRPLFLRLLLLACAIGRVRTNVAVAADSLEEKVPQTCDDGQIGQEEDASSPPLIDPAALVTSPSRPTSWEELLRSNAPIVSNGDVYPEGHGNVDKDSCLLLLTHSRVIRSCPPTSDNEAKDEWEDVVLFSADKRRFRGAFVADDYVPSSFQGSNNEGGGSNNETPRPPFKRLWLLTSPLPSRPSRGQQPQPMDLLEELDVETQTIVQRIRVSDSAGAHDAVKVGPSVFVADTRHGTIIELAVPRSAAQDAPPAPDWNEEANLEEATVVQRHVGYTKADHVNNLAIHRDYIVSSLHGGSDQWGRVLSPTRLSVLPRSNNDNNNNRENEQEQWPAGGEMTEDSGLGPIKDVGKWCHGIAFFEDGSGDVKLLSLDSSKGELVSVVVASGTGAEKRKREVLWSPDMSHPALQSSNDNDSYKGSMVFAKGLALQANVAYFGVSRAKQPAVRLVVNPTLLVAVDVLTKKELWVKEVQSHGLINQVVSEAYLYYNPGTELSSDECEQEDDAAAVSNTSAHGAKIQVEQYPPEILREFPTLSTINLSRPDASNSCRDEKTGLTRKIPLALKGQNTPMAIGSDSSPENVAMYLCTLNVTAAQTKLRSVGMNAFLPQNQKTNAEVQFVGANIDSIKPGVQTIFFVFSDWHANDIYHFPWLDDWLPVLDETILKPLNIQLKNIMRMQLALMSPGSAINKHVDRGEWTLMSHRTHVPLITHDDVYFIAEGTVLQLSDGVVEHYRIPSREGVVYEFNNGMRHAVRNLGGDRVHLIIDWADEEVERIIRLKPGQVCRNRGKRGVNCLEP